MKSPLSVMHQAAILGDIYARVKMNDAEQDPNWRNFISNNDVSFPFSFLYSLGFAEFSKELDSRAFVEEKIKETFLEICEYLDLNPEYPWDTASEMFHQTNNYLLPIFDPETVLELEGL